MVKNTYTLLMRKSEYARNHWLAQALLHGIACTCKAGGPQCAQHDKRIQKLLRQAKNSPAIRAMIGEIESGLVNENS